MAPIKPIQTVAERMIERSKATREIYLENLEQQIGNGPNRTALSCSNLAHGFAASDEADKRQLAGDITPNIGIITAYNDMLSAHQPYATYPDFIKSTAKKYGGVAQVAAGVPAMCDGVTQGQPGMELSLFSRDVIALSAGVGLSHNMFDAAMYLGICDKIVPGLVIAALTFGHIPAIFVPAGPMPSGLPNAEKAAIRQRYAEGKATRDELLQCESDSYHSPGTCTFYGTANSNQMLMEFMGLQLPGSSFINPGTPLRDKLTIEATRLALEIGQTGKRFTPIGQMIDERSFINAVCGLHATGGSTNHMLHLIAMAKAAGISLTLEDIADLSESVPLLARVYPNGMADVNHFHAAGGLPFVVSQMLKGGWLYDDTETIFGTGMANYAKEPKQTDSGGVIWEDAPENSGNDKIVASASAPFSPTGGLKLLTGNLGKAVTKISAIAPDRHIIEAPAIVFDDQLQIVDAFKKGDLERDFIAVLRFQGPKANGMPELHKMIPPLAVLQDRGFKVGLVTDGRMSGASGKVPTAIHLSPEAQDGGPIAMIEDGDLITLDAISGQLHLHVEEEELGKRETAIKPELVSQFGMGREMFENMRKMVGSADTGASFL